MLTIFATQIVPPNPKVVQNDKHVSLDEMDLFMQKTNETISHDNKENLYRIFVFDINQPEKVVMEQYVTKNVWSEIPTGIIPVFYNNS